MDVVGQSLSSHVTPAGRFRRSVRLDADNGAAGQLDGYIPTARSLEVIRRLQRAMSTPDSIRAVSITGPYGSGKSSMALFLDALCGNTREASFRTAFSILKESDPDLADGWMAARVYFAAPASGFVRAVITTPQREPISLTVLRAIQRGASRTRLSSALRGEVSEAVQRAESTSLATPSYGEIRAILEKLTARKPMILIIDEFGKNLEAFADSGSDGDLYLLQELAEWANQDEGVPLLVVTIQHLAFDNYVADATSAQRREWSKVQGRFEDVPYVDSGSATRQLIRASLEQSPDTAFRSFAGSHVTQASRAAMDLGAVEVAEESLLVDCFPIHPTVLEVLPELCARYGQNERTLFSFIASQEPNSVPSFLAETTVSDRVDPWVRMDRVYDYFVESAGTFIGASSDASRWLEIETSIRDAADLSFDQMRILKTVGILNLVSGQVSLRASLGVIGFATGLGEARAAAVLEELVESGHLVYREFAREFRLWRGSDFDIASALRSARTQAGRESVAKLLGRVHPLDPIVAARHSIRTGTTRSLARVYADRTTLVPNPDEWTSRVKTRQWLNAADGLLIYNVDPAAERPSLPNPATGFPLVLITPKTIDDVVRASVEIDALTRVRDESELDASDSAAWKEINERIAHARQVLDHALAEAFDNAASTEWVNPTSKVKPQARLNAYLSSVLDATYSSSPVVLNETLNRTDLTSQGARARRELVASMLDPGNWSRPLLGLEGDGPEVSMYHAVLESTGIHRGNEYGRPNAEDWRAVWDYVDERLHFANDSPLALDGIIKSLGDPPYGLREGPAMVLVVASLIANRSSIAIYEHGSYRPVLDAPLSERLMKNPANFSVKYLSANPGTQRHDAIVALASALRRAFPLVPSAQAADKRPTILTVTLALMALVSNIRDDFTKRTSLFQTLWDQSIPESEVERLQVVRDALFDANEPDVLLFDSLPSALGYGPLPASGRGREAMDRPEIEKFAGELVDVLRAIDDTRSSLCRHLVGSVLDSTRSVDVSELERKAGDLEGIDVLNPDVKRFGQLTLMREMYTDEEAWMSALTEAVCGRSFFHWDDESTPRLLRRLGEVSADFARVSELVRFRTGRLDGAFRAFQIQATSENGETLRRIVTLPTSVKVEVAAILESVTSAVRAFGLTEPREVASALLASLIDSEIAMEVKGEDVTIELRSENA